MKPNSTIDVADFIKQQLENQSLQPPVHIWENVEKQIPTYRYPFFKNWWVLNSVFIIIGLSLFFWISKDTLLTQKKESRIAQKTNSLIHEIRHPTKNHYQTKNHSFAQPLPTTPQLLGSSYAENQNKPSSKIQQSLYYIEMSIIGELEKIEILDTLNNIKKIFSNLSPNEYGYYELDIHNLLPGKYKLVFYKKDGKKIFRTETFK